MIALKVFKSSLIVAIAMSALAGCYYVPAYDTYYDEPGYNASGYYDYGPDRGYRVYEYYGYPDYYYGYPRYYGPSTSFSLGIYSGDFDHHRHRDWRGAPYRHFDGRHGDSGRGDRWHDHDGRHRH